MTVSTQKKSENEFSIVLDERFDFGSVEEFRRAYEQLATLKQGVVNIDFRLTRYMDSSALGMLLSAKSFFDGKNIKLKIVNINEQIRKILSISRFEKKFIIE